MFEAGDEESIDPTRMIQWHKVTPERFREMKHAVTGGKDETGDPVYVARCFYEDDLLPATFNARKWECKVSYGMNEHEISEFEVMFCDEKYLHWRNGSDGDFPGDSVEGCYTTYGEPLFIGRVMHDGHMRIGKVHPSHRVLYIPHKGQELHFEEYEVLCFSEPEEPEGTGDPPVVNPKLTSGIQCVVCVEKDRVMMCTPCNHVAYCERCLFSARRLGQAGFCPFCRKRVKHHVKIFFA